MVLLYCKLLFNVQRGKPRKRNTMSGFTIVEKKSGEVTVLTCTGAIDYGNFEHGDDLVKKSINSGSVKLIFDLGGVSYISSSGWTIFLSNLRAVRDKGGDIMLTNMNPDVLNTFKLLELDNLIDNFDTVAAAIKRMH